MPLCAGFARAEITPAVGAEIPGDFTRKLAKGIHDPLWVEAAYLTDGSTELAMVGVDSVMLPREVVETARAGIAQRSGMSLDYVLIAASHTHTGGPVVDCFASERDPAYCQLVALKIAEAVEQARRTAVPCRLAIGVSHEDTVAFNRRFRMRDGSCKTHPGKMNPDIVAPAGPIDPAVGVLAMKDLQGALIGCVVNYALHGTTMSDDHISADWPGYLRQTIRAALGGDTGVVFLNGACGDVTQVDNRDPRPPEFGEEWARRAGSRIGAEALSVIEEATFRDDITLAVKTASLPLAIRDLGVSDEELVAQETPAFGLGSGGRETYLREVALLRETKTKSSTVDVEIQAFRIGEAAIVGNPTELFCELGLAIKDASPWRPTFVVELANGYTGYAPTSRAFQEGGYETRTARSSFLAPDAGEQIVEASIELLQALDAVAPLALRALALPPHMIDSTESCDESET